MKHNWRVLVFGGRDYANKGHVFATLDKVHAESPITLIVHGACPYGGADILGEDWAKYREIPYLGMPAKFKSDGRRAGPERNQKMLLTNLSLAVQFPGGKGTVDMALKLKAAGIRIVD